MRMPVVDVREVRVLVNQCLVPVPVLVWLVGGPREVVFVLVVFVVNMAVAVLHRLVHVFVLVAYG